MNENHKTKLLSILDTIELKDIKTTKKFVLEHFNIDEFSLKENTEEIVASYTVESIFELYKKMSKEELIEN